MEMPNTNPQTTTQELLEAKYQRAAEVSAANYSFYMGATNDNLQEVLKTDPRTVCGIKVFMGSSTGNMLVDDEKVLSELFASTPMLIATIAKTNRRLNETLSYTARSTAKWSPSQPTRISEVPKPVSVRQPKPLNWPRNTEHGFMFYTFRPPTK
jgi:dihydroorotase